MYKLGFSTCPNDTFIFDALVNARLNEVPEFTMSLADVSELNSGALAANLDITKLSFGAIADVSETYQILDAGSALGFGCGPLLISKELPPSVDEWINKASIAIPGRKTTANLLLSMAFPQAVNKTEMLFSEIEDAVINGIVDAGLIIHENRFTYEKKGLKKIIDLGAYWEGKTGLPIPLGCIAIKRNIPEKEKLIIQRKVRESVEFAFQNPDASAAFVAEHAQEMDPEIMKMHIDLYVNKFSVRLGEKGRNAVNRLLEEGIKSGIIAPPVYPLFLNSDSEN